MTQGWHSILLEEGPQNPEATSFIGGKPKLPINISLPVCKDCGTPLTFFFQVAFPEGHHWAGKSLALFYCIHQYNKHTRDKILILPDVDIEQDEFHIINHSLAPERYQTQFRAIVFDTELGVMCESYVPQIVYREITWKPSKKKDKKVPIILGGEPIGRDRGKNGWFRPLSYDQKPMDIILQVAEYFNFPKYPDAPPEMEEDVLPLRLTPREKPDYTLWCEFNRIYLWGPIDPSDPVVYIDLDNDI